MAFKACFITGPFALSFSLSSVFKMAIIVNTNNNIMAAIKTDTNTVHTVSLTSKLSTISPLCSSTLVPDLNQYVSKPAIRLNTVCTISMI